MLHSAGYRRRHSFSNGDSSLTIRVGSRHKPQQFQECNTTGTHDALRVQRLVGEHVKAHPREALILAINGFQPWLTDLLACCTEGCSKSDVADLALKVQSTTTMQFPARASQRSISSNDHNDVVPWTFIVDHINVPQVFYWSVNLKAPDDDDAARLPEMSRLRLRMGVWNCSKSACVFDRSIPVTILFNLPDNRWRAGGDEAAISIHIPNDVDLPRKDEAAVCWIFSRLYWLFTDWQNIIGEVNARLVEAEANSHGRHLPVKTRTRVMHHEVDRLFELKEYLHFHTRAFKKLQRLSESVPRDEQNDAVWAEMDDAIEDLEQYETTMDGMKERFNNLIELEFNIQNAIEAENAQFLSAIATLFLPISYLATVFALSTSPWPITWYLYSAIPVFIISIAFTAVFPWAKRRVQDEIYPARAQQVHLNRREFTMLGNDLPDHANAVATVSRRRSTHRGQRQHRYVDKRGIDQEGKWMYGSLGR